MDYLITSKGRHPVIYVDVETSGLDPQKHMLLSIGAVFKDHTFEAKLRPSTFPPKVVDDSAMAVNGLSMDGLTANGEDHFNAAKRFVAFVKEVEVWAAEDPGPPVLVPMLGGYNTQFDARFIRDWLNYVWKYRMDSIFWYKHIDVFSMAVGLQMATDNLGALYQDVFDKPLEGAHDALTDAKAARDIAAWISGEDLGTWLQSLA